MLSLVATVVKVGSVNSKFAQTNKTLSYQVKMAVEEWIHRYNTLIPVPSNHTLKHQLVTERLALMSTKILNVSLQQNSAVQKNLTTSPFDPGT